MGDLSVRREDSSWPSYQALAFDIECLGEEGFPTATNEADLILQISCVLWSTGEEAGRYRRILLTLGTCEDIEGVEVYEFPSELDMLYAFFQLIRDLSVEIVTGYNVANFDWPYILDRARHIYRGAEDCKLHVQTLRRAGVEVGLLPKHVHTHAGPIGLAPAQ